MDLWHRAKGFAEEAAKRSQELSTGAAKLFTPEFVTETAKKSKEIAAEATKKADLLASEARRAADQIRTLAIDNISNPLPAVASEARRAADQIRTLAVDNISISSPSAAPEPASKADLERFGVTEELREFVRGLTITTFTDFPLQDEPQASEVQTVSNVRQDLNQWQASHATLMLKTVKEISKFRYDLCPRYMKERKFWHIYFIIVNNFVAPYEKRYLEELQTKAEEKKTDAVKENPTVAKTEVKETKTQSKTTSSTAEQDLDVFLLGDLGSDDDGPDVGDDGFDDDLDKIGSTSGLDSDDDDRKSKSS